MTFSFRTGINWYHDFPKLARDSGFYFNMHKNKMRIDWNRIAGVDIERVIQDRNFSIIDENIYSIIDYNLDSEYDVKILDPNFVKLFRLAQLSVEYLLYCKQYLDHSVVILKDELRSKIEENVRLKKELALADEDLSLLKDKLKNKYKILEKMYSETQKDVYKCPYCKKTFSSPSCTNDHIFRRHSNSSQFSFTSPVHDRPKTETEKLNVEMKNLKETFNQTERIISNESEKSPRNVKLNGKNDENQTTDIKSNEVNKDNDLKEEHKPYQEEMNNLKAMFVNEIKNLREDDKKFNQLDNENENLKESLKQQENEIHRLTDQIRELSSKQLGPNLEMIQLKLISQEEYWKSKIDQIESQHKNDIEGLSKQLKMTQEIAERMRNDYIINIKKLEATSNNCDENFQIVPKSFIASRQSKEGELYEKYSISDKKEKTIKFSDEKYNAVEDKGTILEEESLTFLNPVKRNKVSVHLTDLSENIENNTSNLHNESHLKSDCQDYQQKHSLNETKHKSQSIYPKVMIDEKKIDYALPKQQNTLRKNSFETINMKIDVSSSQSDVSESESETLSNSEDSEESQLTENQDFSLQGITVSDQDKCVQKSKIFTKKMENFKHEVLSGLEQKLSDLGVDIEIDGIPKSTYQRLIIIIKHHRNISNKKYQALAEIRRDIINKINKKFFNQKKKTKKLNVYNTPKRSLFKKSIINDKLKIDTFSNVKTRLDIPKITFEKTGFIKQFLNENNRELLPMKMTQQKFQDSNTTPLKLRRLKEDDINRKRLSSNNKQKSSGSQIVNIDLLQQENINSVKFTPSKKNKNINKCTPGSINRTKKIILSDLEIPEAIVKNSINNEKDKYEETIFLPKSLNQNDNGKDNVDISSINDNDDDDGNEDSSHNDTIKTHNKLNKFPQPAPRIIKENLFGNLQSVKKDLIIN